MADLRVTIWNEFIHERENEEVGESTRWDAYRDCGGNLRVRRRPGNCDGRPLTNPIMDSHRSVLMLRMY